jgi:hypothetical protein
MKMASAHDVALAAMLHDDSALAAFAASLLLFALPSALLGDPDALLTEPAKPFLPSALLLPASSTTDLRS